MFAIRTAAATLALVGAIAGPAAAQSTPTNTVSIDNCQVRKSDHQKFTYAYCAIVTDTTSSGSVQWKVNLPTYTPPSGGTWRKGSGTYKFGAGQEVLNIKFAVKSKTVAQVKKSLKVTLSNPKNVTITDGTATAASS